MVKSRNTVAGNHDEFIADGIDIADFALIKSRLIGQLKIRLRESVHIFLMVNGEWWMANAVR